MKNITFNVVVLFTVLIFTGCVPPPPGPFQLPMPVLPPPGNYNRIGPPPKHPIPSTIRHRPTNSPMRVRPPTQGPRVIKNRPAPVRRIIRPNRLEPKRHR